MPRGADAHSDPVDLSVAAGQDLAVSLYTPSATGPATWHAMALTASYLAAGDHTADDSATAFTAPPARGSSSPASMWSVATRAAPSSPSATRSRTAPGRPSARTTAGPTAWPSG